MPDRKVFLSGNQLIKSFWNTNIYKYFRVYVFTYHYLFVLYISTKIHIFLIFIIGLFQVCSKKDKILKMTLL